jgi:nicotinamide mononucleotide transporter
VVETLLALWSLIDEPLGALLGLFIVACLIRENVWAWPLGIAYVVVSVTVLLDARLYANLALHVLAYLPMNIYGWYAWTRHSGAERSELPVTRASPTAIGTLLGIGAAGTLVLGLVFARTTDAALPYWDNGVLVASVATMWLTARKKLESWILWFVIDVVSAAVYWAQALPLYAGLYVAYLAMAVAGWRAWRRSMGILPASPTGA